MPTINTSEDLIRALQENPEWKAAARAQLLQEELRECAARFDAYVAAQAKFRKTVEFRLERLEVHAGPSQLWPPFP